MSHIPPLTDKHIAFIKKFIREYPAYTILGFGCEDNHTLNPLKKFRGRFIKLTPFPHLLHIDIPLHGGNDTIIYAYNHTLQSAPLGKQFNMTAELKDIISPNTQLQHRTIHL